MSSCASISDDPEDDILMLGCEQFRRLKGLTVVKPGSALIRCLNTLITFDPAARVVGIPTAIGV